MTVARKEKLFCKDPPQGKPKNLRKTIRKNRKAKVSQVNLEAKPNHTLKEKKKKLKETPRIMDFQAKKKTRVLKIYPIKAIKKVKYKVKNHQKNLLLKLKISMMKILERERIQLCPLKTNNKAQEVRDFLSYLEVKQKIKPNHLKKKRTKKAL